MTADECIQCGIVVEVYDANGQHIDRKISEIDFETGRVEIYDQDENGRFIVEGDHIKRRVEYHPAPLICEIIGRR